MNNAKDQKVKIAVDEILESFDCTICFCKMKEPCITKCGHSFCKTCAVECIGLKHECPSCRTKLTTDDIYKNFSLEVLLSKSPAQPDPPPDKLHEERDKEQQNYFENLAQNAVQKEAAAGPIETVFMLNLRESLLSYQTYLEDLLKEKEALKTNVKMGLSV